MKKPDRLFDPTGKTDEQLAQEVWVGIMRMQSCTCDLEVFHGPGTGTDEGRDPDCPLHRQE
jgi:hypothetical protein